ncbi:MAG: peptidoglycan bridge formation glycyltransferase FemA/FemB family protein [Oscillospiraceae bacterium]|nr:peptidoglycan bridge formation glycyltransferase FemA/FemB family protein [Oscillospiraceae bacterium]
MIRFAEEKDLRKFEEFVLSHGGQYLQSAKWADAKTSWGHRFYSGFSGEKRVLTALVLIRSIPGAGKLWYCPAGPVCDYTDGDLLAQFAAYMTSEMKKHGGFALFLDPCIPLRVNGEKQESGVAVHNALLKAGFVLNPSVSKYVYKAPVQMIVPLFDREGKPVTAQSLLKSFEKGIRYSVRVGESRGLTEAVYTIDDVERDPRILEDFSSIMDDTSDRNDFTSRNNEYVKNLMKTFGPEGMDVMLIYYDRQKDTALEEERQKRKEVLETSLETAPEKKLRGIREEIESIDKQHEHFAERMKETEGMGDRVAVAGGVTSNYGGTRSCLFGGARNLLRNNLRASHFFNFRRLSRSIDLGCRYHDLGYVLVEDAPLDEDGTLGVCPPREDFVGIEAFKRSFGAEKQEYIGEYALVANRVRYFSYTHLIGIAKQMLGFVHGVIRRSR